MLRKQGCGGILAQDRRPAAREIVAQLHPPQGLSNAVTMQAAPVPSNFFPPTDVPSGRRCESTKSGSWQILFESPISLAVAVFLFCFDFPGFGKNVYLKLGARLDH